MQLYSKVHELNWRAQTRVAFLEAIFDEANSQMLSMMQNPIWMVQEVNCSDGEEQKPVVVSLKRQASKWSQVMCSPDSCKCGSDSNDSVISVKTRSPGRVVASTRRPRELQVQAQVQSLKWDRVLVTKKALCPPDPHKGID